MSETDWDERRDMEARLSDGKSVTVQEVHNLIADADERDTLEGLYEGLKKALLENYRIVAVDATTDDDCESRVDLFQQPDDSMSIDEDAVSHEDLR